MGEVSICNCVYTDTYAHVQNMYTSTHRIHTCVCMYTYSHAHTRCTNCAGKMLIARENDCTALEGLHQLWIMCIVV